MLNAIIAAMLMLAGLAQPSTPASPEVGWPAPAPVAPALAPAPAPAQQNPPIVTTTVRVTVTNERNEPVGDVPIDASFPYFYQFGFTDASGRVDLLIKRAATSRELVCGVAAGLFAAKPLEERWHANDRFNELFRQYAIPSPREIMIDPAAALVEVQITLYDPIKVRGRIARADGTEFVGAVLTSVMGGTDVLAGQNGVFECHGARKGHPLKLFVADAHSQAWLFDFGPERTWGDLDVGVLTITRAPTTAAAKVKATNFENAIDKEGGPVGDAMTLVSNDGQVLYMYGVHTDGSAMPSSGTENPYFKFSPDVRLAPGLYYVAPGAASDYPADRLITLVRANRQVELDASNAPKFTAVEGQTVEFTFDLKAAMAILQAIAEQPPVTGGP